MFCQDHRDCSVRITEIVLSGSQRAEGTVGILSATSTVRIVSGSQITLGRVGWGEFCPQQALSELCQNHRSGNSVCNKHCQNCVRITDNIEQSGNSVSSKHCENSVRITDSSGHSGSSVNRHCENSVRHCEKSVRHCENSVRHYENSVRLYENSVRHYENSVRHYENSVRLADMSGHSGAAVGVRGKRQQWQAGEKETVLGMSTYITLLAKCQPPPQRKQFSERSGRSGCRGTVGPAAGPARRAGDSAAPGRDGQARGEASRAARGVGAGRGQHKQTERGARSGDTSGGRQGQP